MNERSLRNDVQFVRGVGPARADLLHRLDLHTVEDILFLMPKDVLDLTVTTRVPALVEGLTQSVRGSVVDRDSRVSRGRMIAGLLVKADGGYVRCVWFNQPFILQKYAPDDVLLITGTPKLRDERWEFTHPVIQRLDEDDCDASLGILPRYPLTEGLRIHELRKIVRNCVEDYADLVVDPLPKSFIEQEGWMPLQEAVINVHTAPNRDLYDKARRRLLLDDLLEFQLGLALRRHVRETSQQALSLPTNSRIDARIQRLFPFPLTEGQSTAIAEIARDLADVRPMHRLLQADVGAGKTAVAVAAMLQCVANKAQTALMAPTETLAVQHWDTIDTWLQGSKVERGLLTGQTPTAERRRILEGLKSGQVSLVVGTQTLIQDAVEFQRLGLVVIDEQHKFGVEQRSRFARGEQAPHLLVMTATPIPRTLCLTAFGDLDITTIRGLPPGRQPIGTYVVTAREAARQAWNFIKEKLRDGRQMYVVCPRVESKETLGQQDVGSAEAMYERLRIGELKDFRLGLMHGRMNSEDRREVMDRFRNHDIDALVATSVIEVGVDVPNASLLLVFQADRFGLSQLHQIRGRVGRGAFQGHAFLFCHTPETEAIERLKVLEQMTSGFEVAEADFRFRGPGDVLGTRQHGELPLRRANLLRDTDLVELSRSIAQRLVETGRIEDPEFITLRRLVHTRFDHQTASERTG